MVIIVSYVDIVQVKKVEDNPEPEPELFCCDDGDVELVEAESDTVNVKGNLYVNVTTT